MQKILVNDELKINIKKLGINGEGIGYKDQLAIFVDYALPEEDVLVEITEVHHNRAVGKIKEILNESPDRVLPFCPVYDRCGGCQVQHINYEAMLKEKKSIVLQAFDRYIRPKIDESIVKDTIRSPKETHYRNKASLPIQLIDGKNRFGMYVKESNIFIPIEGCPIQKNEVNQILSEIVLLMDHLGLEGFQPKIKRGGIHTAIVRVTEFEHEAQVTLVTYKKDERIKKIIKPLLQKFPYIKTILQVYQNNRYKKGFFDGEHTLLFGEPTIKETLNGKTFTLRPEAFFQLNTLQAHQFYMHMKNMAQLKKYEVVIDGFAGIAPVSHYIHDQVYKVFAIELEDESAQSAKLSVERNGIKNVTILRSDFHKALIGLKNKKIDVMFFDPPRTGLGEKTIESILSFKPKRLIYGSCNPSTLAKDLNELMKHYNLVEVTPIDMFPQTSHVESIVLLSLKTS